MNEWDEITLQELTIVSMSLSSELGTAAVEDEATTSAAGFSAVETIAFIAWSGGCHGGYQGPVARAGANRVRLSVILILPSLTVHFLLDFGR